MDSKLDSKSTINLESTNFDNPPPPYAYGSSEDLAEGGSESTPFIQNSTDTTIRATQPARRQMMSLSGPPPNPLNLPTDKDGQREWSHGLFDCAEDCGTFAQACCCTPCLYGRNKSRLDWLNATGNPHPASGRPVGTDCGLHLSLSALFGMSAPSVLQCIGRSRTRQRYSIKGNYLTDCLSAFLCSPCQLTQESRELDEEERALRQDFGGVEISVQQYRDEEEAIAAPQ